VQEFDDIYDKEIAKRYDKSEIHCLSSKRKGVRERQIRSVRKRFKLGVRDRFLMLLVYYHLYINYTLAGFLFDLDQSNIYSLEHISEAKLYGAIILKSINFRSLTINDKTNFNAIITDDINFFDLLEPKIKSGNTPILIKTKDDLIKELKKKSYTEDQIERFVSQSKFS
jgi:DDE superfamily endonuclease